MAPSSSSLFIHKIVSPLHGLPRNRVLRIYAYLFKQKKAIDRCCLKSATNFNFNAVRQNFRRVIIKITANMKAIYNGESVLAVTNALVPSVDCG